eukprot:snap_masked-scaffold_12-processed-gene-9.28-mRNA-1 protein AED:1.00 eAED:1.00 QI:0/0/0/0/1/1/2/0/1222
MKEIKDFLEDKVATARVEIGNGYLREELEIFVWFQETRMDFASYLAPSGKLNLDGLKGELFQRVKSSARGAALGAPEIIKKRYNLKKRDFDFSSAEVLQLEEEEIILYDQLKKVSLTENKASMRLHKLLGVETTIAEDGTEVLHQTKLPDILSPNFLQELEALQLEYGLSVEEISLCTALQELRSRTLGVKSAFDEYVLLKNNDENASSLPDFFDKLVFKIKALVSEGFLPNRLVSLSNTDTILSVRKASLAKVFPAVYAVFVDAFVEVITVKSESWSHQYFNQFNLSIKGKWIRLGGARKHLYLVCDVQQAETRKVVIHPLFNVNKVTESYGVLKSRNAYTEAYQLFPCGVAINWHVFAGEDETPEEVAEDLRNEKNGDYLRAWHSTNENPTKTTTSELEESGIQYKDPRLVDDHIVVFYGNEAFPATIVKYFPEGTYDIEYTNKGVQETVKLFKDLRVLGHENSSEYCFVVYKDNEDTNLLLNDEFRALPAQSGFMIDGKGRKHIPSKNVDSKSILGSLKSRKKRPPRDLDPDFRPDFDSESENYGTFQFEESSDEEQDQTIKKETRSTDGKVRSLDLPMWEWARVRSTKLREYATHQRWFDRVTKIAAKSIVKLMANENMKAIPQGNQEKRNKFKSILIKGFSLPHEQEQRHKIYPLVTELENILFKEFCKDRENADGEEMSEYFKQARLIIAGLKKNENLRNKWVTGEINSEMVSKMKSEDFRTEARRKELQRQSSELDNQIFLTKPEHTKISKHIKRSASPKDSKPSKKPRVESVEEPALADDLVEQEVEELAVVELQDENKENEDKENSLNEVPEVRFELSVSDGSLFADKEEKNKVFKLDQISDDTRIFLESAEDMFYLTAEDVQNIDDKAPENEKEAVSLAIKYRRKLEEVSHWDGKIEYPLPEAEGEDAGKLEAAKCYLELASKSAVWDKQSKVSSEVKENLQFANKCFLKALPSVIGKLSNSKKRTIMHGNAKDMKNFLDQLPVSDTYFLSVVTIDCDSLLQDYGGEWEMHNLYAAFVDVEAGYEFFVFPPWYTGAEDFHPNIIGNLPDSVRTEFTGIFYVKSEPHSIYYLKKAYTFAGFISKIQEEKRFLERQKEYDDYDYTSVRNNSSIGKKSSSSYNKYDTDKSNGSTDGSHEVTFSTKSRYSFSPPGRNRGRGSSRGNRARGRGSFFGRGRGRGNGSRGKLRGKNQERCRFYARDMCKKGNQCAFLHD